MKSNVVSLCAVSLLVTPMMASAAPAWMSDGKNAIAIGQAYFIPQEKSSTISLGALGLPKTGVGIDNTSTVLLTASREINDNVIVDFVAGAPLKITMHANGMGNKIGTVKQYNPSVVARYLMGKSSDRLRPFVGLGATYAWYDKVKIDNTFKNVLTLGNPDATVTSKLSTDFKPVVALGATYAVSKKLEMVVGVAYTPLRVESTITSNFPKTGTKLENGADVQIDPIIASILFAYKY